MTYTLRLEQGCEAYSPEHVEEMFRTTFTELELFQVEIIDQGRNVVFVTEGTENCG